MDNNNGLTYRQIDLLKKHLMNLDNYISLIEIDWIYFKTTTLVKEKLIEFMWTITLVKDKWIEFRQDSS